MELQKIRDELQEMTDREFVDHFYFKNLPWFFRGRNDLFEGWRRRISRQGKVDTQGIFIVGSASTGYSLNPSKLGRPFRVLGAGEKPSDIDVAVANQTLFAEAWNEILTRDRKGQSSLINADERNTMRIKVYWGHISGRIVPRNTSVARRLLGIISETSRIEPFVGYSVNIRIYRRTMDLIGYQIWSIREVRRLLRQEEMHEG